MYLWLSTKANQFYNDLAELQGLKLSIYCARIRFKSKLSYFAGILTISEFLISRQLASLKQIIGIKLGLVVRQNLDLK